ncbi:MAG: ketoacyl-ACP synthase III [Bacteroidales bacterium]|nr:ketoacyl-ACP synthase III [Bacteroidales bacterium]
MNKIRATITGIDAFVPDYILTNEELSQMVDTSDEWIMSRVGIKERHILKGEAQGTSVMAAEAVKRLLKKTNTSPDEIDFVICATITADMAFPSTSCIVSDIVGIKNAFAYDLNAACSGYIYALVTAAMFVESGQYKKVLLIGADKMSSITDYTDRTTCPLFGDAATATLIEPTTEDFGVLDHIFGSDGYGRHLLYMKAGGSLYPPTHETIDRREHYLYQDGQPVFKYAVSKMADVSVEIMKKNKLAPNDLTWLVPHQANLRIIDATARRMGILPEQVMINIQRYGNTTAATIPLCLWEWENQLKKGDNLILTAFGGGFTWGAIYLKWGYDQK